MGRFLVTLGQEVRQSLYCTSRQYRYFSRTLAGSAIGVFVLLAVLFSGTGTMAAAGGDQSLSRRRYHFET